MSCDRSAIEELQICLRHAFAIKGGYRELNGILDTATDGQFNLYDYVAEGPMSLVIPDLRIQLTAHGYEKAFLTSVRKHLPCNFELREWARRFRPDLQELVSEDEHTSTRQDYEKNRQKRRVDMVSVGISRAGNEIEISADQRKLPEKIIYLLKKLHGYKSLHEIMHQLQMRVLSELDRIFDQPDRKEENLHLLSLQTDEIELASIKATDLLTRHEIFGAHNRHAIIEIELGKILTKLRVDDADANDAHLRARYELRTLLRQQMPSLDDQLVQTASEVPFGDLKRLLTDMTDGLASTDETKRIIAITVEALHDIDQRLIWRRDVHQAWQQIDDRLWFIDIILGGKGSIEELNFLWQDITELTKKLIELDSGPWIAVLDGLSQSIDTSAQRGFSELSEQEKTSFRRFASTARMQFFKADAALLQDCNKLNELRGPLEDLIGDV